MPDEEVKSAGCAEGSFEVHVETANFQKPEQLRPVHANAESGREPDRLQD